ncbi:ATP-binding protein [Microcoleus sp. FACHB-831]|uniref:ATP-binding protein n=1 Tax=Microcoleus sp. FACHB-831 TaxID=2692827 RepID=UPI001682D7C0|nr:ATP-binding protein [Microcoleus sp. FACHB-831]MBD1919782.1 ATP-binding protein [Microcoleus sp. FACHB-831]
MSEQKLPSELNASPTKSFFVEMLTRDIELEDAILDLLDNCIDGIQRIIKDKDNYTSDEKPYEAFWAKLTFSNENFTIKDNCGGIPIDVAQSYAFRMGRPNNNVDNDVYTIGTYGIGMKRSIFKMGRSSEVISQTETDSFKVTIHPEWLTDDKNWNLPFEIIEPALKENGTLIKIADLYSGIINAFSSQQSILVNSLVNKISHHYSYILYKGFTVWINEKKIAPKPLNLLWDGVEQMDKPSIIAPYLYESEKNGVDIKLAIGFYRPTASEEEVDDEMAGNRRSSEAAGWTIVCNDRVVLYCDKTRLTGWGEERVPSYHPQFIAISGVVYFRSKDARKLPITTTKRGIDASSDIYLYIKDFMREGLKIFTSYTNKWKTNIVEEKRRVEKAQLVDPNKLFQEIPSQNWIKVRNKNNERKYIPSLPMPETQNGQYRKKNIKFSRPDQEIKIVAEYLFEDSDREPSEVGNECFEKVLREARQ